MPCYLLSSLHASLAPSLPPPPPSQRPHYHFSLFPSLLSLLSVSLRQGKRAPATFAASPLLKSCPIPFSPCLCCCPYAIWAQYVFSRTTAQEAHVLLVVPPPPRWRRPGGSRQQCLEAPPALVRETPRQRVLCRRLPTRCCCNKDEVEDGEDDDDDEEDEAKAVWRGSVLRGPRGAAAGGDPCPPAAPPSRLEGIGQARGHLGE